MNKNHNEHEHSQEHNHLHNHEHSYACKKNKNGLLIVLVFTTIYMVAEFVGGYFTNSLALMADAGHMLGDVASLGLSFFALWLSGQKAPITKTFGYYRGEILAALANGITLIIIAFLIIYEAYQRFAQPQSIDAPVMIVIATGGLLVNIVGAMILHKGSKENLNIKGAFLHVIGDLLGSIGAIVAGILVWGWGITLADPVVSVLIAILVLYSSINLVKSAVQILMESAPKNIKIEEIQHAIGEVEGVIDVYDLHVWSITSNWLALSVHVIAKGCDYEVYGEMLNKISCILKEKFNIDHSTIQIEPENFRKPECPFKEQ